MAKTKLSAWDKKVYKKLGESWEYGYKVGEVVHINHNVGKIIDRLPVIPAFPHAKKKDVYDWKAQLVIKMMETGTTITRSHAKKYSSEIENREELVKYYKSQVSDMRKIMGKAKKLS